MKIYRKRDYNATFIIAETEEEAQNIWQVINDNTYMEGICQKAEIVPEIFAVRTENTK